MKSYLKVFLIFVLIGGGFLCFGSSALSQDAQVWTNLGLYGGQIYDIAIDPNNFDKMFAGSFRGDGLFMTTDGGSSWQAVEPEGVTTFKNKAVYAIAIVPGADNESVIWVANQYTIEKSADGGQTWIHILNQTIQGSSDNDRLCLSLAVDPNDPDTIYVGTSGSKAGNDNGAIYKTENGGTSWIKMNGGADFDYNVVDLDLDPSNPNFIWAVTGNGGEFIEYNREGWPGSARGTLYRGEGDTWTPIFPTDVFPPGGQFYDVEVHPSDSNSIFTANDWGIFRHYYEGAAWQYQWILNYPGFPSASRPNNDVYARNVRALAFDSNNSDILYAAWKNAHSFPNVDTGSKVARHKPGDSTWAQWDIYPVDHQFLALAVHPSPNDIIFGGELAQGVYKSQDHGQSWTKINNGINAVIVNDVDVDPNDNTHLLAATISGVYEKRGTGNWKNTSDFPFTAAFSVAFDPTDVNGSTYFAGTQNWLAKTTNVVI